MSMAALLVAATLVGVVVRPSPAFATNCGDTIATVNGVDIKSNGADADTGNSCGSPHDEMNSAQTPSGSTVTTGYMWQCVEFVNRYYVQKGWISSRWSGNGNTLKDHLPSGSFTYTANGSITSIVVGDVVTLTNSSAGHAGVVSDVVGNTITIANQNVSTGNSTATYNPTAKTLSRPTGFGSSFTVQGVIHTSANAGSGGSGGTTGSGRIVIINSSGVPFAKDEIAANMPLHHLTGNGTAFQVSAAGTHVAVLNSSSQVYMADVSAAAITTENPTLGYLDPPQESGYSGGTQQVAVDNWGNMMAINNCGKAYAWRGNVSPLHWEPMSACGEADAITVGNSRLGLLKKCSGGGDAGYISDTGYTWTQIRACGQITALSIGGKSWILAIDGGGTAIFSYDGVNWHTKSGSGDAKAITMGRNRIMYLSQANGVFAANVDADPEAGMTRVFADGAAIRVACGQTGDRMLIETTGGETYAADNIVQDGTGAWYWEQGVGDTTTFAVG
jgi:ribosomal protein S27E